MRVPNEYLEEIDYFHHFTSDKDGQNIIDFGLVPYLADDSFYGEKLSVADSPKIVLFTCFKLGGNDITKTLDEGQSAVMLKFDVDQINYKDFNLYGLDEQDINGTRHKKIFMVHVDHKEGLDFAKVNNFKPLDIEKNNYLRYDTEEKKWFSWRYIKGGLIVDIAFCSYKLPTPRKKLVPVKYTGTKPSNMKFFYLPISKPSPITEINYNIADSQNKIINTYEFKIESLAIGTCCSLQKKSSQPNHSSPFQKNLLNTIMRCSNDKIKIFSMSINGNDFQTIKSLSDDGKITIIDANTISIVTNLGELVTISIIHTKKSPLSPLADRNS
ncbi:hypothetical protein ACTFIR_006158 [Dictyostelium discoideum]